MIDEVHKLSKIEKRIEMCGKIQKGDVGRKYYVGNELGSLDEIIDQEFRLKPHEQKQIEKNNKQPKQMDPSKRISDTGSVIKEQ